jgi:hypothetical protein
MLDLDDLREIENFDISEDHDLKPINLMRKGLKFRKDLNSVYGSFPNPKWYLIYDALQSDKLEIEHIKQRIEALKGD